ncbi:Circadian locomoter output cycles protein kaput [Papilio machaon]|uniref:Circadian locomoter output cycles protein kaput n=1 Tax=Papilio machaon TaxID=76193 RepID=A0A194QLE2_PAPMA|nr:Circadian locomoter output cycles protein kaput [Papilio machaon]
MEDDSDDKDDTKRRTRNLSEKKRRDTFNMLVNELSSMVTSGNRKMDKSTVLKSTISFLKNHNEVTVRSKVHDVQEDWKPAFLSNEEFTYLVLEALEGFVMVFSATGQIYYVSESIASLLGHNPADLINKSVFDLTFEDDLPNLYNLLQNPGTAIDPTQPFVRERMGDCRVPNPLLERETKGIRSHCRLVLCLDDLKISVSRDDNKNPKVDRHENEIRFQCHLRRSTLDFRDDPVYELIEFNGHFRTNMEHNEADEMSGYQQEHESRLLFVCTGRLYTPQLIRDVSLVDTNRNEFTSRHSLEWKFLFLDHRAPPIIGYLPFEVLGTSGFDYYHFDDLEKVITCHEALMQKGELTSCYYRFLTKGQQWIWLQTRFYITYHQWNSKPEFVVCNHRVVSYADIVKSTKQEQTKMGGASDMDGNQCGKEPAQETSMVPLSSPTYMSDAGDTYGGSYHTISQSHRERDICRAMAPFQSRALGGRTAPYLNPAPYSIAAPSDSVKSASGSTSGTVTTVCTAGTTVSWPRSNPRYMGSDNGSLSGESRSSHRNTTEQKPVARTRNNCGPCHGNMMMFSQTHKSFEPMLAPQYGIGAQYLEPASYVGAVGVPGVLPVSLPPLPVIVSPDQTQIQRQEQLQRKHEELQQMIVRQQEELRQVKEQLMLARLGILQPLVNVPNAYAAIEDNEQSQHMPAQITYDDSQGGVAPDYQEPSSSTDPRHDMP